jgi:hypothetical protein
VEEVEDAGDGGGEVEEEMGDNEHVGLYTHEGACDADVERDDPGIEERGNGDLVRVYGRDDGGLKASILGVVEAIEGVDDGLIVKAGLGWTEVSMEGLEAHSDSYCDDGHGDGTRWWVADTAACPREATYQLSESDWRRASLGLRP